ncbi:immunity 70 family protein [Anaerocolumna sp. AGMB13025]|uniref:immunity 70 family protein n=1 Tax=Anaerocolumna sp. AGMB13025 TaxID=3039116 RepID=UPI00241C48FA|nr:immunity 70 family protein [Anaerocolumna sp. AGMB13025]WFR59087.1 immunity 70 family protein [Anaerocolumna sp. AGMB13025]
MTVGLSVSFFWYQVGSGDFFHSFFSTIAYNLEDNNWGSRYPVIMNQLYQGEINCEELDIALIELEDIYQSLKKFSVDKVVWDIEDLTKRPPWGNNISNDITDLSNYFVTSEGEDLITTFKHALEKAKEMNTRIKIETI